MAANKRRTIVYIDGFNLFYAMKEKGWKKYYWLDVATFSTKLMSEMQILRGTKYFTSRISGDSHERQP